MIEFIVRLILAASFLVFVAPNANSEPLRGRVESHSLHSITIDWASWNRAFRQNIELVKSHNIFVLQHPNLSWPTTIYEVCRNGHKRFIGLKHPGAMSLDEVISIVYAAPVPPFPNGTAMECVHFTLGDSSKNQERAFIEQY